MSGTTTVTNPEACDILQESVKLAQHFLNGLLLSLHHLPKLDPQKAFHANQYVTALSLDIGTFVKITTLISKLTTKRYKASIQGAKESHIQLLFIMKGINQAHQKMDLLALEELLKYELKDNLTQWKIDLLPQAKRILNS